MRMDENSNPEWKKMLEGSSSGRKALERIRSLETENQRLRDKVADWQNRFTEGLQYDSENNQTVLVWTQREIDQAKSEADELCRKLGIPLEKEI